MEKHFKKYGAVGILLVMLGGCLTYLPPLFSGITFVFGVSQRFSSAEARIQSNVQRIDGLNEQINVSMRNIREFRAVWCLDRLSGAVVQASVREACTKWIKEP